jgi:type I restriction enzyme, R subunit
VTPAILRANEDSLAERPAIEWLEALGWSYVHGSVVAPDGQAPERAVWSDVVLEARLASIVSSLNSDLPPSAVEQVVADVVATASPNVIDDHAAFHDLLLNGVPVSYRDDSGSERATRARLIDFRNPKRNDFLVMNQFTIVQGTRNRRPDVLLFVNGLPLGEIELKNPGDPAATAAGAVNQIHDYRDAIPGLYRFCELVAVSDLRHAGVGTLTSEPEHFSTWRSMDERADRGKPALQVMIEGVFAPERLLDMIESFVLFKSDGARLVKILAKYHQVDAVRRAVEASLEALNGDGRVGVVWHTQGAGKSLTMAFYAQKVRREPAFANPTIVALTDRNDLDEQLYLTFAATKGLAESVVQAERISGSADSLHSLLQVPAGGVVFTTIQKLRPGRGETTMPVLSERRNIIVMADEAHRSQYAQYAQNLVVALPHALRIGFTGTPIEKGYRSTSMTFGDYISKYTIGRAIEDGATVPIYYENRRVPLEVENEDLLAEIEEVLEDEEEGARKRLVTRWAQLAKVVGSEDRLRRVAEDIANHYQARTEALAGKALVVGMTRDIAARLAGLLKERLGEEAVTCVVSVSAQDSAVLHGPGGEYRRSRQEMKGVALRFKDFDDPLRVVVVRDMWLTGFDVPSLHTMYVDKPMKDHGLLQAIARVNRVFRDKPGGLIVDYIGIGEDLRKSLAAYDEKAVEEAMIPLGTAIKKLIEAHEIVRSIVDGAYDEGWEKLSPGNQATKLCQLVDHIVEEPDEAKRFLKQQGLFQRWFALVSPHPPAREFQVDAEFLGAAAGLIRKTERSDADASANAEQAVKQFFSEGLAAGEVIDVLGLAEQDRPNLSVLSDDFLDTLGQRVPQENLRRRLLERLLSEEIRVQGQQNPMQAQLFGDRLDRVLAAYDRRQLTSAQVIERLIELAKELRESRRRHDELGLSAEEVAFYDALAGTAEDGPVDPRLAKIAQELVQNIRADLSVDWTNRESTEAAIRRKIKRLLRTHGYKPPSRVGGSNGGGLDTAADLILQQARVLYATWPDVPVLYR